MSTTLHGWFRTRSAVGGVIVVCLIGLALLAYLDPFHVKDPADRPSARGHSTTDSDLAPSPAGGILNSILHDEYLPRNIHGASIDRLDMPEEPSLPLDEAIAKSGLGDVSLPDASVLGEPVKVVLNETVRDRSGKGRVGLMILYESGVKLLVSPGALDLQERMDSFEGALPFRDGRSSPYEMQVVADRPALVAAAGVQYQGSAEIEVEANLIWNVGDAHYWLKAPRPAEPSVSASGSRTDGETRALSESIGIDDLIAVAESLTSAR